MIGRTLLWPVRRLYGALRTTRRTVSAVPDVVEAVLVLPTLKRQLEAVEFATATLPDLYEELRRVRSDTSELHVLPDVDTRLAGVDSRLAGVDERLQEMTLLLEPIGRVADRIPQRRVRRADRRTVEQAPNGNA